MRKDKHRRVLKEGESERKNGYQYRWTVNGKRYYIYANSLDELRKKEERVQKEKLFGLNPQDTTLNEVYEVWLKTKRGIRDTTFQSYKRKYKRYAYDEIGYLPVKKIKRTDIKSFYNNLENERELGFGTIRLMHMILHQLFDIAIDEDIINKNPCNNALKEIRATFKDRNELKRREKEPLTKEQENAFLDFVKNDGYYNKYYPLFATMLKTGMRISEALGLCWENVNLKEKYIEIDHALKVYMKDDKCTYSIGPPKTAKSKRKIPLLDETIEILSELKEYRLKRGISFESQIDGYNDFVFFINTKSLTSSSTINRVIKAIAFKYVGKKRLSDPTLPYFTCHSFRYTYATRLCESGVNIKVIQEILGHEKIDTTMEIYVKATGEFKKEEIETLQQFYKKMGE